jgi:Domain of unknown function (DUF1929)
MKPPFNPSYLKLLLTALTSTVLSCGGSGDLSSASNETPKYILKPTGVVPADAHINGMWSPVVNWPIIPIHAALLPDGRVLTYGTDSTGNQSGYFIYDVWDPKEGLNAGHLTLPNATGTDIFCASQVLLPESGNVFIAGGDIWNGRSPGNPDPASGRLTNNQPNKNSNVFSTQTNGLARGADLNRARWYSSSITLLNGDTYIQGGSGGADRPEVRQSNGAFRLLSNADTSNVHPYYPRNFIAPNGQVFGVGAEDGNMYYVDPDNAGAISFKGKIPSGGWAASAVQYKPGQILMFGGATGDAAEIDMSGNNPIYKATTAVRSTPLYWVNATSLANGHVLATGGGADPNSVNDANLNARIWNPDTKTWQVGASAQKVRLYHSTALLLPDGTVLVGGGGAPGPQTNLNAEIYYPPYLFTPGGTLAARPQITSAPTVLNTGQAFSMGISSSKAISRVVMVKNGSVTHSFNMGQSFVELNFRFHRNQILTQMPLNPADAPPGFYMLFILDSAGVPSESKFVRVNAGGVNIIPALNVINSYLLND